MPQKAEHMDAAICAQPETFTLTAHTLIPVVEILESNAVARGNARACISRLHKMKSVTIWCNSRLCRARSCDAVISCYCTCVGSSCPRSGLNKVTKVLFDTVGVTDYQRTRANYRRIL